MKRIIIIAVFGLFSLNVGTSTGKLIDYPALMKRIEFMKENDINRLIYAIGMVESCNDTSAIGLNDDTGILQITPILVKDYNIRTSHNYKISDCFKKSVSLEIFIFYANRIGTTKDHWEEISKRWNASSNWEGKQAEKYWIKVRKYLNS